MKKLILTTFLFAFVAVGSLMAQKIGHVNSQELLLGLPAYKTAQSDFQAKQKVMQSDLEEFQKELEALVADFETNSATWTETKKQLKAQEIQDKKTRLEQVAYGMEEELGQIQQDLMKPLLDTIQDAINGVAKDGGYAYVLDLTTGTVVYWEGGTDLGPMVRKKLGIPEPVSDTE